MSLRFVRLRVACPGVPAAAVTLFLLLLIAAPPSAASPYPSTLTVNAIGGSLHRGQIRVMLDAVTHPCPEELAILLVHNDTDKYLLMSNAGGCRPLQGTTVRFLAVATPIGRWRSGCRSGCCSPTTTS